MNTNKRGTRMVKDGFQDTIITMSIYIVIALIITITGVETKHLMNYTLVSVLLTITSLFISTTNLAFIRTDWLKVKSLIGKAVMLLQVLATLTFLYFNI